MKRIKFRKWFSKRLFDQAKGDFDRARRKVDEAKDMILLAKSLTAEDAEDANNKEDRINNESSLEQLVISKVGAIQDLSPFGQFLLGYLAGDFLPKIEKGLPKSQGENVVSCINDKFKTQLTEKNSDAFISTMVKKKMTFDKEVIEGVKHFEENITKLKGSSDASKVFKDDELSVEKFIEAARDTVVSLAKNVNDNITDYAKCLKDAVGGKAEYKKKKIWEKVLDTKFNFSKTYDCKSSPQKMLTLLGKRDNAVNFVKNLWNGVMKNGYIENKMDTVDWYKTGKAVGGIGSLIIKPLCVFGLKESMMMRWRKRYLKK